MTRQSRPMLREPVGELVVAGVRELGDHVGRRLEVGLDRRLGAAADDDDVIDPGAERLVDDELERRRVADRHQLLRHGLGGREEAGPGPAAG